MLMMRLVTVLFCTQALLTWQITTPYVIEVTITTKRPTSTKRPMTPGERKAFRKLYKKILEALKPWI